MGYTMHVGVYEVSKIDLMIKFLPPDEVKIKNTIDVVRLGSILISNETIRFTKRSFFYTMLGFTQSHLGPLGDIEER